MVRPFAGHQNENRRLVKENFNLHEMVAQLLGLLQSLARQKKLIILNDVETSLEIHQYYEPLKILIYNLLVRTGPGILYPSLRRANFPGEYNIYEEKNGYGRISATQKEWISLSTNYVQRLSADKGLAETEKISKLWAAHPELH
ncbi:MAG: hypothetical protein HGA75_13700 [Thiobacillus sp.]|nr:hypothetical protein [Thiobacillus sp.]